MFSYINKVLTCDACGSTAIAKTYIFDATGEVDGQDLSCHGCGAFQPGW